MQGRCHHGLPAADCLICRSQGTPAGSGPLASADQRASQVQPEPKKGSLGLHTTGVVLGIIAIGVIAWVVAGAVFALLHIIELILVGGAAAWAGYRVGKYRGSRRPR